VTLQQHTAQLTKKYDHLTAEYTQLKANHEQLRQMVLNMASQSGDTCAPPPFWHHKVLICNEYYLTLIVNLILFLKHI
jgi:hypothetical protein